jgi:HlyD family secretion protein
LLVLLVAAGAVMVAGAQGWKLPWRKAPEKPVLMLSGNIEAHESVLSFKTVQSRITQLPFNEGQWVKQGDLVAAVDDTDYQQQILIAEANLAIQQRQLESARENTIAADRTIALDQAELDQRKLDVGRAQTLQAQNFISRASLDQTQTGLKQAHAALERDQALKSVSERAIKVAQAGVHNSEQSLALAKIIKGYTQLTAPFDGVLTVRQAEIGEMAIPGSPVATIADLDHIWLRVYVNETDVGKVKLGQIVNVTTDSHPGKKYQGKISFIASKAEFTPKSVETHAERVTLVYRAKIDIDNPSHELLPGMPADAEIDLTQR